MKNERRRKRTVVYAVKVAVDAEASLKDTPGAGPGSLVSHFRGFIRGWAKE
jgi:hypothetical protein